MWEGEYFEVSVEDIEVVQGFESDDGLDEHAPDFALLEEFLFLLVVDDLLVEVAIVCKLHDYAESVDWYHRFLPSRNTYLYPMMFLFLRLARIRTSFRAFSIYFSERLASFTFFSAYTCLSASLSTLNTVE